MKYENLNPATTGEDNGPVYKNIWICNCEHGWHNCTCDGNGGKKLMCCACNETFIYSKEFEVYRCDACYEKEMERKANESTPDRNMQS